MSSILNEIAEYKRGWVAECKQRVSETELVELARTKSPLDFAGALQNKVAGKQNAVIAEVKKASPSKGIIRPDFDPVSIARSYESGGASCLSVLTDVKYFQGKDEYVTAIREAVNLPILRKDFMLDPYQIIEAKAMGADAVLVILAMVDDVLAADLTACAHELNLSVLPEVHNAEELERAMKLDTQLMGINNRNLHSFETALDTTISLLNQIDSKRSVITESGIFTATDIKLMNENDVYGFLIGESLMRQTDPGEALQKLMS
ncbi:indole-3-glycerol phosphate synthase [Mariprofundus micogutta]|uniref:Indole-3-glycerol phosphate synthase n=1 Tax=Mariprofundus micogutta TaxID=1921010 RepID=A0A1L8CMD8_9PROT|nr:indole-3-glycerol phosphate synthase TrpC [Mariprofundus micogutta]GAV20064.1 indole-3-glycerol phosphate synthase [Mariprofundus micogutta]